MRNGRFLGAVSVACVYQEEKKGADAERWQIKHCFGDFMTRHAMLRFMG